MGNRQDYISIPRDIFGKLKAQDANIPKAFSLYFYLCLRCDWKNRITTTMQIIACDMGIKDDRTTKKLFLSLNDLQNCDYIEHNLTQYDSDAIFKISIKETFDSIAIQCVNEELLALPSDNRFILLSMHCYFLLYPISKHYGTFSHISYNDFSTNLAISETTVGKSIVELEKMGLIRVVRRVVHNKEKGNAVLKALYKYNLYEYYPFDKRINTNSENKNPNDKILDSQPYLFELDDHSTYKVLYESSLPEYCPRMLIGNYSFLLKDIYTSIHPYRIFTIEKIGEVDDLIERFYGIKDLEGRILVINIGNSKKEIQSLLLLFVENTSLPLLILSDIDNIIPPLVGRMKFIYKQTMDVKLASSPQTYFLDKMTTNRFDNYKIDDLIAKTTNGSTFHNLRIKDSGR